MHESLHVHVYEIAVAAIHTVAIIFCIIIVIIQQVLFLREFNE
jgi:hypothetical protein